jgi:dihydroorotate dehydrogenase (fumarate)
MIDLRCNYLGLALKNPIIIGSSGLTSSVENLIAIEKGGAGAVVLKSIFEEQIKFETDKLLHSDESDMRSWQEAFESIVSSDESYFDEAFEYLTSYAQEHTLDLYLQLVKDAKKSIAIPVIASIHCNTRYDWQYFAKRLQDAGADAIELNAYILPSDFEKSGSEIEQVYFDIIAEVKKYVSIPVSLKIGYYFSSLAQMASRLSETGIAGLTLFNRPFNPDIDINTLEVNASNMFSNPEEYSQSLRWVALLSGRISCDIAASTGIHNYETIIKQLLAGADAVQMVSLFYRNGFDVLPGIIANIEKWMTEHNYHSIADFKGLMSRAHINNPASYERVQFIRQYSSIV